MPVQVRLESDRFIQIGINQFLGPSGKADDFVNHSCEPNSGIVFKSERIFLVAIKDIEPDEEITWDYCTTIFQTGWSMLCDCREPACRK